MIYSFCSRWKYISIVIIYIIFVCILNTRSSIDIDIQVLNNYCHQNNYSQDIVNKKPIQTESDQVSHIKVKTGDIEINDPIWNGLPAKGAFYMIVQNSDLHMARATIRSLEDRFNSKLNTSYPWIILNSQPFTNKFKKFVRIAANDPNKVFFGQIDLNAWSLPYWINSNRVENAMKQMFHYQVENSDSHYSSQLQRYQAGLFMHHSLFDTVDYIWQVELGTTYTCDLFQNDPFKKMKDSKKKIGFSSTSKASPSSMFSLWPASLQFMKQYSQYILPADKTIMPWLLNSDREYNFCNIWTSFQIVETSFLRSPEYQIYFQYLDYVGGFFYERWSAASVRSIAAAMYLKVSDFHFFNDVGYIEKRGEHCPLDKNLLKSCTCQYQKTKELEYDSCSLGLLHLINPETIGSIIDFVKSTIAQE